MMNDFLDATQPIGDVTRIGMPNGMPEGRLGLRFPWRMREIVLNNTTHSATELRKCL